MVSTKSFLCSNGSLGYFFWRVNFGGPSLKITKPDILFSGTHELVRTQVRSEKVVLERVLIEATVLIIG